jgi:Flp pilus assembly protein TadD
VTAGYHDLRAGDAASALASLERARELRPDLPQPYQGLGLLADREGRPDKAEEAYRAALKLDPDFVAARIQLAQHLLDRGTLDEAREQGLRLTQSAPGFVEGWIVACEALLRLGRVDEARTVLTEAHRLYGSLPALARLDELMHRAASESAEADRAR